MDMKDIANTVKKFMPFLASVIDEANPIAGLIVMAIANKFNVSSNPSDIIDAITKTPDAAIKLKEIEDQHADAIYQNQIEDRANARNREQRVIALTGKRDWILDFIAMLVIAGFFTLCLTSYFVKSDNDNIIVMLIGQISSGFMLCLSYYFGSSNK